MVEITIGWSGQLQSTEANVIQSFIVNAKCFIGVFHQLVNRQCGIVWLHNSVRDLKYNEMIMNIFDKLE